VIIGCFKDDNCKKTQMYKTLQGIKKIMLHNAINQKVDYMQSLFITLCCKDNTSKLFHKLGLLIKKWWKRCHSPFIHKIWRYIWWSNSLTSFVTMSCTISFQWTFHCHMRSSSAIWTPMCWTYAHNCCSSWSLNSGFCTLIVDITTKFAIFHVICGQAFMKRNKTQVCRC
jgi:hypothetical protein